SRNTVVLAFQSLLDDGYLTARERSGYFVADKVFATRTPPPTPRLSKEPQSTPDWIGRLRKRPGRQENISKPLDWQSYPYPFIYGQVAHTLFPLAEWRDCAR